MHSNSIVLVIFFLVNAALADSCVTVTQKLSSSWNDNGAKSQWDVVLTGVTPSAFSIKFNTAPASSWNINGNGAGPYTIASYAYQNGVFPAGASYSFGYIIASSTQATITVTCAASGSSTPAPSTPAPSTPAPTPKSATPAPSTPAPTPKAATPAPSTPAPTPKAATQAPTPAPPTKAPQGPTPAPPTFPPSATSAPSAGATTSTQCDVVFIVDSYITRTGKTQDAIRQRYTSLFADIQAFYANSFGMKMNLKYMFFEDASRSFSDTTDAATLLDNFRSALVANSFTGIPVGACMYHLITGRQTPGIGGLSWVGTACDAQWSYNNGFTVDQAAAEDSVTVIRRMTHEMGHTFGGQHYDWYSSRPAYTCDAGYGDPDHRILRNEQGAAPPSAGYDEHYTTPRPGYSCEQGGACDAGYQDHDGQPAAEHASKRSENGAAVPRSAVNYNYLPQGMFFTECSSNTIKYSLPAFRCLWTSASGASAAASVPAVATATLWDENNLSGNSLPVPAVNGVQNTCYNIVYPYGGTISSFTLSGSSAVKGLRFFGDMDCKGTTYEVQGTSSNYVGDAANEMAYSYQFIY